MAWPPQLGKAGQGLGGRYRLDQKLGDGPLGTVFLGMDGATGKAVAIKVFAPYTFRAMLPSEEALVLARRKQLAGRIAFTSTHVHRALPGIIHHHVEHEPAYVVMEALQGQTLRSFMTRWKDVPRGRIIAILQPVLAALAHVHAAQLHHGNVKLDNVFVETGDNAKLMDFCTAFLLDESATERLSMDGVKEGMLLTLGARSGGPPREMSPERAMGHPTNARTDVYGMGIILFHMLTGGFPFNAASRVEDLIALTVQRKPDPRELAPGADPHLSLVCNKALSVAPEARYANGAERLRALRE
jgi:serine/threonine-protein kinase